MKQEAEVSPARVGDLSLNSELPRLLDTHKERMEQVLGAFAQRFLVSASVSYPVQEVERVLTYMKNGKDFAFMERPADSLEWGDLFSKSMQIRVEASKHFGQLWAACLSAEAHVTETVIAQTRAMEEFLASGKDQPK